MGKIIRTKTKAHGGITPAEKSAMDKIAQEWIGIAMRTDPIQPGKIAPAIHSLYAAAKLKKPRVVIVPSPLVMAFAYGAAAWIWHCRNGKSYAATDAATRAATYAATSAATYAATESATDAATYAATAAATSAAIEAATSAATSAATYAATSAATSAATYAATSAATSAAIDAAIDAATSAATSAATYAATSAATYAATDAATVAATYAAIDAATYTATAAATSAATVAATAAATSAATDAATDAVSACLGLAGDGGIKCARLWSRALQGGAMWAGRVSYYAAARDVLGLHLPMLKPWEDAARHGGFRVMHKEFCIVSDFPEYIRTDDQNRPHCETGPSHRWRDGWSLYHWHGVRIPGEWVEDRKSLTAAVALSQDNAEVRRAACEILGWSKILADLSAREIDKDGDPEIGTLVEVDLPDAPKERFLRVLCGTKREFALPVPREMNTALEAQAWTWGLDKKTFIKPEIRT